MFGFFEGPKCPKCGKKIDKKKKHCPSCGIYIVEDNVSTPFSKSDFPGFKSIYLYGTPLRNGEYPILKCFVKHNNKSCGFVFTNQRVWAEPVFSFSTNKSFEAELKDLVNISTVPTGKFVFFTLKNNTKVEIEYENEMDTKKCFAAMQQALVDAGVELKPVVRKSEPPKSEPPKSEPPKSEPPKPAAPKPEPPKPEPPKPAAPKPEPPKPEPPKPAAPKPEPPKLESPEVLHKKLLMVLQNVVKQKYANRVFVPPRIPKALD